MTAAARRVQSARRTLLLAALTAIALLQLAPASAHDNVAWKADRETRFAAFKSSHPPQDAAIAALKLRTETLIETYVPPPGNELDHPPVIWRTHTDPLVVFDIPVGPRMVVVPAGEFTMGPALAEPGHRPEEAPRHRVHLRYAFAVSMFPITYGEYAWFSYATGYQSATSCVRPGAKTMHTQPARDWDNPGFTQMFRSPATCIGFRDATAYVTWLSKETGQKYRLLSEAEYEYANRAGTTTAYWWGDDREAGCKLVNGLDRVAAPAAAAGNCDDGFEFTMPLDSSKPNGFGLFDTTGNVASWTADCWRATYAHTPANGAAEEDGNCRARVVRGGSWSSSPGELRAAARATAPIGEASATRGFRIAREL